MTIVGQLTKFAFGPAIHKAAFRGDIEKIKTLIKEGANPNALTRGGLTPLMLAVQKGHKDITAYLITHGADVNAKGENGFTALHSACLHRNYEIAEVLLDNGADVNAREDGNTPLMLAAYRDDVKLVRLLLSRGADPRAFDDTGKLTTASMARGNNRDEIRKLLNRNETAQQQNRQGITLVGFSQRLLPLRLITALDLQNE